MNKTIETNRGTLEVTLGKVTVDSVGPHPFHEGERDQAQIRQVYITHYPSSRPNSSLVEDLFEISEFGLESSLDAENVRVTWIDIPLGTTQQQVEAQLEKFQESTVYRILGDDVRQVMTAGQMHAAHSDEYPDYDTDKAKRKHVVMRVNQKSGLPVPITKDGQELEGSVTLTENGKVAEIIDETGFQYRATGWARNYKEDIDLREPSERIVLAETSSVKDKAKVQL